VETMESVAPFVDEVRSTRSVNTLRAGLDALDDTSDAAPSVRETSRHLRDVLADSGYGSAA
jgi:hypothetical protein